MICDNAIEGVPVRAHFKTWLTAALPNRAPETPPLPVCRGKLAPAKRRLMERASISLLTICGLEELDEHSSRGVTHVLSILDPAWPDPPAFERYDAHHRMVLRFHDVIEPGPGLIMPEVEHVEAVLGFIDDLLAEERRHQDGHVLIHCHAGISRSTAAMAMLLAKTYPDLDEGALMERLFAIRAKAWPNSRMIGFADEILGRGGRLSEAARQLHARQLAIRPNLAQLMRDLGRGREVDAALGAKAA
jgi:predicted protein tyrosine phosphatase